ncbi:MAG: GNAT family N-acyltransferase [Hyphomicrobium sp.]|nr:GNAT family N-acyltransferase [Hyphomicrobium sp.]
MRLRERLEQEFAIRFDDLSTDMKICVERIEQHEQPALPDDHGRPDTAVGTGFDSRLELSDATRLNSPTDAFPISIGLALSCSQRERVFQLRHDSFVEAGWITPQASRAFSDAFDDLPTSVLVEAVADGRAVATLRIAMATPQSMAPSLPCEVEFPREIADVRARTGGRLAEFSRVAIAPDITNTSFKTTLYGGMVRTAFILVWAAGIDYAFAAVHERVSDFYRHMIGFDRLARSSSFGIIAEPTELLGCPGARLFQRAAQRRSFFHVDADEIEHARVLLQRHFPALAVDDGPHARRARSG